MSAYSKGSLFSLGIVLQILLSSPLLAESISTRVSGTFNESQENSCLLVSMFYLTTDCSYNGAHQEIGGKAAPWVGPTAFAVYYPVESRNATPKYVPVVNDDRIAPTLSGIVFVDDMGTPDPLDDAIGAELILGPAVRSFIGRPSGERRVSRGVETWKEIVHKLSATTVNQVQENDNGGFDYFIGSKGFPERLCQKDKPTDCFPSPNAPDLTLGKWGAGQWSEPSSLPIGRGKLLGANIGGTTEATVKGYSCRDLVLGRLCNNREGGMSWGKNGMSLTNLLLRVSTDEQGTVLRAEGFWTIEYRFGVGKVESLRVPVGETDSWWGGYLQLVGTVP